MGDAIKWTSFISLKLIWIQSFLKLKVSNSKKNYLQGKYCLLWINKLNNFKSDNQPITDQWYHKLKSDTLLWIWVEKEHPLQLQEATKNM